jgi:hypothetical protein
MRATIQMIFRKLRIAWSVASAIACVLLCGLCVRSYQRRDEISLNYFTDIGSNNGTVYLHRSAFPIYPDDLDGGVSWITSRGATDPDKVFMWQPYPLEALGGGSFALPHWVPIMISAALAVAPWIRWRFSLRALLIATTLVAVFLGAIVWLSR